MIEVHKLTKQFGSHVAVKQLSFSVEAGSIFGILGPNGSGKTTTVRMLCGLLLPDAGTVNINGLSVREDPVAAKEALGVLPDGSALFPQLTIWEHLMLEARVRGLSEKEAQARAEDLLRYTDLWDKRRTRVSGCSVGMRKKLGIALAVIHKPPVMIMDEPFDGLDPVSARKIRNLFMALQQQCGSTLIITSHVLALVEELVDRVMIIGDGAILEILEHPRSSDQSLLDAYLKAFDHDDALDVSFSWLG